jgi:hypothetical protein
MARRRAISSDALKLPDALREVNAEHGIAISYTQFWGKVARGEIPAHRVGGRWWVLKDDIPRIVQAFRTPSDRTAA